MFAIQLKTNIMKKDNEQEDDL